MKSGDDKIEQALYWPESMLEFLQQQAARCDRSISYVVQLAWKTAQAQIVASEREVLAAAVRSYEGTKHKQSLFFPRSMIEQFAEQAARLDSSQSLIAQAAVALARGEIEKLPTVEE